MIEILYEDKNRVFCVKPAGYSSEDDLPHKLTNQLRSNIYTVHRLDKSVSGVIVYAKNNDTASRLSRKIQEKTDFKKVYYAICEGKLEESEGIMEDLLFRDSHRNKSYVVNRERRGVKNAVLRYRVLSTARYKGRDCSLVKVELETGRTHQIRVQFAARKHPLLGDRKYGSRYLCPVGLFSHLIETDGMCIKKLPPDEEPWKAFREEDFNL